MLPRRSPRSSAKQQVGGGGRPTSPQLLVLLAALVLYACLAGTFMVVSLSREYDDDVDDRRRGGGGGDGDGSLRLPVPLRTVGSVGAVGRHLMGLGKTTTRTTTVPENYFQLSPPAAPKGSRADDPPHPWSWPIIHVVSTRFMQGQGNLVNLARSRLKLLEVVCLPSLMGQTIFDPRRLSEVYEGTGWEGELDRHLRARRGGGGGGRRRTNAAVADPTFLWIIKVDPNLDGGVLDELRAVLEPAGGFAIVVGSNTNYGIGIKPGGWRGGEAGRDVLDAYDDGRAYFPTDDGSGARRRARETIRRAHAAREDRVVLETRLDADDAVNVDYLATLQRRALRTLVDRGVGDRDGDDDDDDDREDGDAADGDRSDGGGGGSRTARWLYWCPRTHVQWNPSSSDGGTSGDPGTLQVLQMPYHCITPGLTLGFAVGTREEDVPRYTHDKLFWEITVNRNIPGGAGNNATAGAIDVDGTRDCGLYPPSRCAVFVDRPRVAAFRSRALTSAGMNNLETRGKPSVANDPEYEAYASRLWEHTIEDHFGIETERAREAADFLLANYLGTIKDNLRGQCTHGHSCKISSIEKLRSTIDVLEEETGGVQIHPRGG